MPTKNTYFSFDNLVFEPISPDSRIRKAHLDFSNGFSVNVYVHTSNVAPYAPYEVEPLPKGNNKINTFISDDNIGYCTKEDVDFYIKKLQHFKKP